MTFNSHIQDFLPDVRIRNPFAQSATGRHLLTHTSGIDCCFIGSAAVKQRPSLKEFFRRRPPTCVCDPRQMIVYSHHGIALAVFILEETSRLPFHEYVRRSLLSPLGVNGSTPNTHSR